MKKVLALILSLVLVFTLVAVVACDGANEPGGNNFKEVDLSNKDTREEFVNALADKVDLEKLLSGDPTKDGWSFGLEEKASSKVEFDVAVTVDETKYSGKGNVELSENAKISVKSNGASKSPDLAASLSLSAKGNVELSEGLYDLIDVLGEDYGLSDAGIDLADLVKDVITNFNYSVDAYVDNEAALIKLSDSLYNKLPEFVAEMLGSKLIKITFGGSAEAYASAVESESGLPTLDKEEVKAFINNVIDFYIIPCKISVYVANQNGYALRLGISKESVLAALTMAGVDSTVRNYVQNVLDSTAKLELTVRVDKDGVFSGIELASNAKLNLDLTFGEVAIKGTVSLSGSVELKKYSGKVSKPSNAADYKELEGLSGGDSVYPEDPVVSSLN